MIFFTWLWNRKPHHSPDDNGVDMQNKKDLNLADDRSNSDTEGSQTIITEEDANEANTLEDVMEDNLELMLEIILKVREDEEFAKTIYEDCPRLQALLDQNPDLRPIFEDPNFVRINFEQVYRNAGGVLPEDQPNVYYKAFKDGLITVTQHPLFRVFRFLLLIKRMYTHLVDGSLNIFKQLYVAIFGINALDAFNNLGGLLEGPNDIHRLNLYQAAEHMEDPAVQEQMASLLESNPEELDEAIEQDPELLALRDSNPLCAELMSDPSTLRILLDPDNLRALAECPDLITADFADPDWMPPQIEELHFDDAIQSMDEDLAVGEEVEGDLEGVDGSLYDSALGRIEEIQDSCMLEGVEAPEGVAAHQQQQQKQQQQAKMNENGGQGGGGGIAGMVGAGLFGYMTAQMGFSPSDMMMGGGGDEIFAIEDIVDDTAQTTADAAADNAKTVTDTAAEEAQTLTENAVIGAHNATEAAAAKYNEQENEEAQAAAYRYVTSTATTMALGGLMMVGGGGTRKVAAKGTDNDHEDKENQNIDDGKEHVNGNPKTSVRRFFQRNHLGEK
jgi:hypothetical protein